MFKALLTNLLKFQISKAGIDEQRGEQRQHEARQLGVPRFLQRSVDDGGGQQDGNAGVVWLLLRGGLEDQLVQVHPKNNRTRFRESGCGISATQNRYFQTYVRK